MKYRGILLDIDNTFYNYEETHKIALDYTLKNISERFSLDRLILESAYEQAKQEVHIELAETASSHNKVLYFQKMCETLNINPLKNTLYFYNLYWDKFIENIRIYENVFDFLRLIKDKKICLLTDLTAHSQHIKIVTLKLFEYANYLVTSEEAGREKPHPYIFMLGLKKLGLKSNEVCMVGNSFDKDIKGATNLGIKSFWLNPEDKTREYNTLVTVFENFKELMGYFYD